VERPRCDISELIADFACVARKLDRETRIYWANTVLRWNDWQNYHMPDDVLSARDVIVAAIINPSVPEKTC